MSVLMSVPRGGAARASRGACRLEQLGLRDPLNKVSTFPLEGDAL